MTLPSADMVWLMPPAYFEPCLGADAHCQPPPEAILYHQGDNTWIPAPLTALVKLWFHLKRYWPLLLLAALLLLLATGRL